MEAEAEFRRALAIQREAGRRPTPPSPTSAADLANSHNNLGVLLTQTGRPAEAEAEYRRALAIQQELAEANPAVSPQPTGDQPQQPRRLLTETAVRRRRRPRRRGDPQELAAANPAVTEFRGPGGQPGSSASCWRQTGRDGGDGRTPGRQAIPRGWPPPSPPPRPGLGRRPCHDNLADVLRRARPARPRPATATTGRSRSASRWSGRSRGPRGTAATWPEPAPPRPGRGGAGRPGRRGGRRPPGPGPVRRAAVAAGEEWFETACCHAALAGLAGRAGSGRPARAARPRRPWTCCTGPSRWAIATPRLPHRGRAGPAPRPRRLPAADDGPGHAGRAVRPGRVTPRPGQGDRGADRAAAGLRPTIGPTPTTAPRPAWHALCWTRGFQSLSEVIIGRVSGSRDRLRVTASG